jgi:hypothetical protein
MPPLLRKPEEKKHRWRSPRYDKLQVNDAELHGFRSLTSAMCLAQTLTMGLAFAEQRKHGAAPAIGLDDIDC